MFCNKDRHDQCDQIWRNFTILKTFGRGWGSFSIWQNFESTLAKIIYYGANFYCWKWPNIEKQNLPFWSHWTHDYCYSNKIRSFKILKVVKLTSGLACSLSSFTSREEKTKDFGQWLWLSWQSGRLGLQRSTLCPHWIRTLDSKVRIQSSAKFHNGLWWWLKQDFFI